jgi:putative DNA methylase
LAACRAVLFASLVDDPSSLPDEFPTEDEQNIERLRLFGIIERLVKWENINNQDVLNEARAEILKSTNGNPPPVYDPFCGGGSIPLEAQRLGLEAHGSDLNPVALLITKALIEIPPKFKDLPPVNPLARAKDVRQEGTGNRGSKNERNSITSGSNCLAEVDGSGSTGLSSERSLSKGGDVSDDQSDYSSGGVGSSEHSGRKRKGNSQGLRQFPSDRQGIVNGNRDVSDVSGASRLFDSAGGESDSEPDCGNQQDANCSPQKIARVLTNSVTRSLFPLTYKGAQGLADDVRYYGAWMRDEAFKRIGHLYPKVIIGDRGQVLGGEGRGEREEGRGEATVPRSLSPTSYTVIAWIWARTVKCPNPSCGCAMPLVRSFALSTKKGKEAWIDYEVIGNRYEVIGNREERTVASPLPSSLSSLPSSPSIRFSVKSGTGKPPEGTVSRKGARCIACESDVKLDHVRAEGKAGRMGAQLMAIVAEGNKGRIYLEPSQEQEDIAAKAIPTWKPNGEMPVKHRNFQPPVYGMLMFGDLFTPRQLVSLVTFSSLVSEAREKVIADGGTEKYADAVATYLALGVSKLSDICNSLCMWENTKTQVRHLFTRQAIPILWDFAEPNIFSDSAGDFGISLGNLTRVIEKLPSISSGQVKQRDSRNLLVTEKFLFSTDPPYYDNICYADLSDFFYVWLRRTLNDVYPDLFSTLLVPKASELIAAPHRFGGNKEKAKEFFENGLKEVFSQIYKASNPDYPTTVYYAFKQTESDDDDLRTPSSVSSTGWETMLEGLIQSGFSITGTVPMRTEMVNRSIASGTNALASCIVLVCRPRPDNATSTTRRQFLNELKRELPDALKKLQQGNIAPVDLAQASIGPGMAVYSKYAKVLEPDGSAMRVRTALQLINQALDEYFAEQEGEFDTDTRWALAWFEQSQFNEGAYGDAETLSTAKNISVQGLVNSGILFAKGGKVRLLKRDELPVDWNPENDNRTPAWEVAHHLIRALDKLGETGAANLLAQVGIDKGEIAKDLSYRLYSICDRKGWTQLALDYNSLVISWQAIVQLAIAQPKPSYEETPLFNLEGN